MVLLGVDQHKWSLGLDRVKEALDILGHPEKSYPHVLVAGTNGKGSTCIYLEKLLISVGRTVGTTMSPHVSRFTERFRINGMEVNVIEMTQLRNEIEPLINKISLTYFEWCVILAVVLFKRKNVDVGIFEVGLGGRYDASNALDPALSLITEISLDHTDYLGCTISDIALEKAQIARPGRPLATIATHDALRVIKDHALSIGALFHGIDENEVFPLPINGTAQKLNANMALKAARLLGAEPSVSGIKEALITSFLPGRIERVGRCIIMDVAHNHSSMLVLVEHLKNHGFDGVGVAGVLADKDYMKVVSELKAVCSHIFIAPVQSPRSWREIDMNSVKDLGGITICQTITQAFLKALEAKVPVVVTGSFYTVGEVRELLLCRGWYS